MEPNQKNYPNGFLSRMGIFGFEEIEPLVLSALVTEDPLLLIGKSGTGKTHLLNSLSEALGLKHRHYNASLISFDDLIGFPYPAEDRASIKFLRTPASVWEAESVLFDEISRCKPDIQNKFFSILYERKILGLTLEKLRYRWAAMNPIGVDTSENGENYEGSEPLDTALADRFAFIIEVPDWSDLKIHEQEAVIHSLSSSPDELVYDELKNFIRSAKRRYEEAIVNPDAEIVAYCRIVTNLISEADFRFSPRRAKQLARNISALLCVARELGYDTSDKKRYDLFKLALRNSIPQRSYVEKVPDHIPNSIHKEAIRMISETNKTDRWISEFLADKSMPRCIEKLLDKKVDINTKSIAVLQYINKRSAEQKALFSFVLFPAASELGLLTEDALSILGNIATRIYEVNGSMTWNDSGYSPNHPQWSECIQVLDRIPNSEKMKKIRARQLFLHLISEKMMISSPDFLEKQLDACFSKLEAILKTNAELN